MTGDIQLSIQNNGNATCMPLERTKGLRSESNRSKRALNSWFNRLHELIIFKRIHGHSNVPQKCSNFPKLGAWVNKQRYRRHELSMEKLAALEAISFDWGRKIGEPAWRLRFQSLLEFNEKYGNCKSPNLSRMMRYAPNVF